MTSHPLLGVIEAADRAITAEDFDALMDFYADEASLVIKPGLVVTGKPAIRKAFAAIAEHFGHSLTIGQGKMTVLEGGGDTALVLMETLVGFLDANGVRQSLTRRASYVFRLDGQGQWRCLIDNSYGTDLLEG